MFVKRTVPDNFCEITCYQQDNGKIFVVAWDMAQSLGYNNANQLEYGFIQLSKKDGYANCSVRLQEIADEEWNKRISNWKMIEWDRAMEVWKATKLRDQKNLSE